MILSKSLSKITRIDSLIHLNTFSRQTQDAEWSMLLLLLNTFFSFIAVLPFNSLNGSHLDLIKKQTNQGFNNEA